MADKKDGLKFLGTGLAKKAGDQLSGRQKQLKKQECAATGGIWDEKTGRCLPRK